MPASKGTSDIPMLEWVVAVIGFVVVTAAIGLMGWEAAFGDSSPPILEATVSAIDRQPGGYRVTLRVSNRGGSAAAAVQIEASLRSADGTEEKAQAQIDYVPARSAREASLIFERDPRQGELKVRPFGFAKP